MTKTVCDICGKELSTLPKLINVYNITIINKNRMCRAPYTRNYSEVCEDCTKKIAKFIDDSRVEN